MGLILQTDNSLDPLLPPPPGSHFFYSKSNGFYAMDSTGTIVGPFTGGSGPPSGPAGGALSGTYPNPGIAAGAVGSSQLANLAVIAGKIGPLAVGTAELADAGVTNAKIGNDAVQTAQIANSAVTGAKIANSTISAAKLANPLNQYKVVYSDTGSSWAFDFLPRVRFGTDTAGPYVARVSILGDQGAATNPRLVRLVDHSAADLPLGYLTKALPAELKGNVALSSLTDQPTAFLGTNNFGTPITVTLPDSRLYAPGSEIVFYQDDTADSLTITTVGPFPPYTSIIRPLPVSNKVVNPGHGIRFLSFGSGWILTQTF